MFKPNDDELFRVYEKDLELRRFFENSAFRELYQSWTFPHDQSTTKTQILKALRKIGLKVGSNSQNDSFEDKLLTRIITAVMIFNLPLVGKEPERIL